MSQETLTRRNLLVAGAAAGVAGVAAAVQAQETQTTEDKDGQRGRSKRQQKTIDESKAARGSGVVEWHIDGPDLVIGQPVCPLFPEYFYEAVITRQEEAEIRYLIWNKIAPPGTGAIERVCVND